MDTNIVEILSGCPEGTKLYSPLFGDVTLLSMDSLIAVKTQKGEIVMFNRYGIFYNGYEECGAECLLFPSKENRDWSTFKTNKPKFDPKTLQPFDKVIVRIANEYNKPWFADFVSHRYKENEVPEVMSDTYSNMVIPFNEDTKHLLGTTKEAPKYYRYWED